MKFCKLNAVALGAVFALALGCNNDKAPIMTAKARYAATLAIVGAYAPFLEIPKETPKNDVRYRVADFARKKIMEAAKTEAASPSPYPPKENVNTFEEPWRTLHDEFKSIASACGSVVLIDIDGCSNSVKLAGIYVETTNSKAQKAGLPADAFPAKLSGWVTPETKAQADRLDAILKAPDPASKLNALWTDPKATYDTLDATCKEFLNDSKAAPADPKAAGEGEDARELAQITAPVKVSAIKKCGNLIMYGLMDKMFGSCLGDNPDANCFNEQSCGMVTRLRDALPSEKEQAPPSFGRADEEEPETLPAALLPKAERAVRLCRPYFH